jgi:hypothetical protein
MAKGRSLSAVVSDIILEHLKEQWIQQTTNTLYGSDTSTMLLWTDHMDQQYYIY